MVKMRRYLVSIPYGMSARNVLRSDIFAVLKATGRVVVLSPLHNDTSFQQEFGGVGVVITDLPRRFSAPYMMLRGLLDHFEGYYFTNATGIETLQILRESLRRQHPLIYYTRVTMGRLGGTHLILKQLRALQQRWGRNSHFGQLFDEFRPDLVFLTHSLAVEEFPVAFEARRRGIPIVAMIHSWDNLTAKSGMRTVTTLRPGRMLPLRFDKVIVWNEVEANELMRYYGYCRDEIFVAGIPQFDFYAHHNYPSREEVIWRIGGDPTKRLITYAAGSSYLLPKQNEIIQILVQALQEERFTAPAQLLIRGHPGSDIAEWQERFGAISNVLFQQPSVAYAALRFSQGWHIGEEDKVQLAQTLYHSDVIVNVASTLAIDAAALNRPIVCIGFDGYENRPYYESIAKHYDFTHYRPVVESGGVRIARSPRELIEHINRYLENPDLDAPGRRQIVEQLCYRLDGKAGERIGRYLVELLRESQQEVLA